MSTKAKKRWINTLSFALMMVIGFIVFSYPSTYAKENNTQQIAKCKQILGGITGAVNDALGRGEDGTGEASADSTFSKCINADEQFTTLKSALKICGGLLILIIAISHLFTNIERGQDHVESVFKTLIEILICGLFIVNLDLIVSSIADFGVWVIEQVGSATATDIDESQYENLLILLTGKATGDTFWRFQATCELFFPWVISIIISGAAKFCVYQAALEIGVRKIFVPLAVADIYQDGLRSPGVRYLKKFLAAFLKIAICAAIGLVIGAATTIDLSGIESVGVFEHLFGILAVSAAGVGFMFKGGEVANDIVGA